MLSMKKRVLITLTSAVLSAPLIPYNDVVLALSQSGPVQNSNVEPIMIDSPEKFIETYCSNTIVQVDPNTKQTLLDPITQKPLEIKERIYEVTINNYMILLEGNDFLQKQTPAFQEQVKTYFNTTLTNDPTKKASFASYDEMIGQAILIQQQEEAKKQEAIQQEEANKQEDANNQGVVKPGTTNQDAANQDTTNQDGPNQIVGSPSLTPTPDAPVEGALTNDVDSNVEASQDGKEQPTNEPQVPSDQENQPSADPVQNTETANGEIHEALDPHPAEENNEAGEVPISEEKSENEEKSVPTNENGSPLRMRGAAGPGLVPASFNQPKLSPSSLSDPTPSVPVEIAKVDPVPAPALDVEKPSTEQGTDFIKTYVSDDSGNMYKSATSNNYLRILSGMNAWSSLSTEQRRTINTTLKNNEGKSYQTLVQEAQQLQLIPGQRSVSRVSTASSTNASLYGALSVASLLVIEELSRKKKIF